MDDVAAARPQVVKTVDTMVQKGKWTVPGYKEKCKYNIISIIRTHINFNLSVGDLNISE